MQGDDPRYLKVVATAKHYAVHSGPEPLRHTFDASVSETDLRETYLPAFRDLVVNGKAESVMCAYNAFRGQPACGNDELLGKILRKEWGFGGYVVSDCGAVIDIFEGHKVKNTPGRGRGHGGTGRHRPGVRLRIVGAREPDAFSGFPRPCSWGC